MASKDHSRDLFFVILFIVLVIEPCIAQTVPSTSLDATQIEASVRPCPSECHVGGDFLSDVHVAHPSSVDPNSYLLIFAYSVTSTTSVEAACDSVLGTPIKLVPGFHLSQTGTIVGENQQSTALVSLISSLGLTGCSPSVSPTIQSSDISTETSVSSITSPALPLPSSPSSSSSLPSPALPLLSSPSSSSSLPSPTTSSSPSASFAHPVSHGLNKQDKIAVGLVVPVAVIASLLVTLISWRRYRTRRQAETNNNTKLPEDAQPYLQQKPELGAEERRTYEREAQEVRYEMQGEDTIHELGPEGDIRGISRRQELQGPEHSKELEVPGESS